MLSGTTLYGTTVSGGTGGAPKGTIFSIGVDGSGFQDLFYFPGSGIDGTNPSSSLTLSGTTMYGTTLSGNAFSVGTNGSNFRNLASTGQQVVGGLTLSGTTLYGMTNPASPSNYGSLYVVGTNGSGYRNLISFSGSGWHIPVAMARAI